MPTRVIANPAAGRGRVHRLWPQLRPRLEAAVPDLSVRWTAGPGDATRLTRAALREGVDRVVAVGGDGTLHEVVNGLFAPDGSALSETVCLVPIPCGTGADFRRSLDIPDGLDAAVLLSRDQVRRVDLLRIEYTRADGTTALRHAVNVTSFGLSSSVAERVHRDRLSLPGATLRYLSAVLRALATHCPVPVTLTLDGTPLDAAAVRLVAIANGHSFGAGIRIAPTARPDDGALDVTVIHDRPVLSLLRKVRHFYRGTHPALDGVSTHRGRRLVCTPRQEAPIWLEADGERLGRLPATIEVMPQALRLQC